MVTPAEQIQRVQRERDVRAQQKARQGRPNRIGHVGQAYLDALEAAGLTQDAEKARERALKPHKPRRRPNNRPQAPRSAAVTPKAAMSRIAKASGVAA